LIKLINQQPLDHRTKISNSSLRNEQNRCHRLGGWLGSEEDLNSPQKIQGVSVLRTSIDHQDGEAY